METLRSSNRLVCMSTPILAEDSTHDKLSLSLTAVIKQLGENRQQNDYLVGLLLVLLAESGFRVSSHLSDAARYRKALRKERKARRDAVANEFRSKSPHPERTELLPKSADNSSKIANSSKSTKVSVKSINRSSYDQNPRIVYIPQNWKPSSPFSEAYVISMIFNNIPEIVLKLIAIPWDDKLIAMMFHSFGKKKYMIIKTSKYVTLDSMPLRRYTNLKEISHKFKDALITPVRTNILLSVGLTSPSLQGLPIELLQIISGLLSNADRSNLTKCLSKLYSAKHTVQQTKLSKKVMWKGILAHITKKIPFCYTCKTFMLHNDPHNSKSDCMRRRIKRYHFDNLYED